MEESEKDNTNTDNNSHIINFSQVRELLLNVNRMHLIWGDVGTGKTTFALQIAKKCLERKQKVFYLNTKRSSTKNILERISKGVKDKLDYLFFWECSNLNEQKEIIFQWFQQIKKLQTYYKHQKIKLIIIDEISSLYLLAQGSEKESTKANEIITFILATLAQISISYHIPILLLSGFSTKKKEKDSERLYPQPFGGRYIKYWTENCQKTAGWEINIKRTSQVSRMQFNKLSTPNFSKKFQVPNIWTWILTNEGFR